MSTPSVTVIDYGVGNLLSVTRGLEHCGAQVHLTSNPAEVLSASRLVLPGVGAFANAMEALGTRGLIEPIREAATGGIPLLGICLGMQLLFDESTEFGRTEGLGLIPGSVIEINRTGLDGSTLKIPHIGWNELIPGESIEGWAGTLLQDIDIGAATYFVHSYMAVPAAPDSRVADCVYGGRRIAAAVRHGAITGCQFHPEKSGQVGLAILDRFCRG